MTGLEPSRRRLPRQAREQRAYRLVVATGAFTVVAVVGFILAIAGAIGGGIPFAAAVLAIVCFVVLRATMRGR